MEELKEKLIQFFTEMEQCKKLFKRETYEEAFLKYYNGNQKLIAAIEAMCEHASHKAAVITELASAIPDYVHERINSQEKLRKKEAIVMDANMTMVTFVNPILLHTNNADCIAIVDQMIDRWNQGPVHMQIKKSTYEELKAGFKSRLCYITTAVCESQNKPDDCYELTTLRTYRDSYLAGNPAGQELVKRYYDIAPTIVKHISQKDDAAAIYQQIFDQYLQPCIHLIEEDKKEECQKVYTSMVYDLQNKYLYS